MTPEVILSHGRAVYRCRCKREFASMTEWALHTLDGTCPKEVSK